MINAARKYKTDLTSRELRLTQGEGCVTSCGSIWRGHLGTEGGKEGVDCHTKSRNNSKNFFLYHTGKIECFTKTQGWNQTRIDTVIVSLKFKVHIFSDSAIVLLGI